MQPSPIFQAFADDSFRFGHCSVRVYDRHDVATYGRHLLPELYDNCLASAPSRPYGILPESFCGMSDLSSDGICSYLATRNPLLLMCTDNPDGTRPFDIIGFAYPTVWSGPPLGKFDPDPGRSLLLGYVYFRRAWSMPEMTVTMMLAGIYFFHTFNLLTLQGQSYPANHLTRKFLAQFGTRDVGVIPHFLFDGRQMVDSHQSCLFRSDFEDYVRRILIGCAP